MEAQRLSVDSESVTNDILVNKLETAFDGCLRIDNAHEFESSSDGVDLSDDEDADELEESTRSDQKDMDNVIQPSSSKLMSPCISSDGEDEEEQPNLELQENFFEEVVDNAVGCSVPLPAPLELVSAFKGSRERRGGAPKKLTVTWDPDVYDPPPTQLLDIVTRGTKQKKVPKKEKLGRKEGQKGKETTRGAGGGRDSSRGAGGSKDKKKKQSHRTGKSGRSFSFMDDDASDNYSC